MKTIVVALGGNALQRKGGKATAREQLNVVRDTARQLVGIVKAGWRLAIVHGNGPQVGRILMQNEAASALTPAMPFDVCGAMSQGMIGYHIQQALGELLAEEGLGIRPVTLVSQVVVDADDPAFQNPTKPIGLFYTREQAEANARETGHVFKEDAGRGWRRVVPSPKPVEIVELNQVKAMLEAGFIPIAAGGGGIPVARDEKGKLYGVDAVIDKDLAACRLAEDLRADILLILTEVEHACLRYGSPEQKPLTQVNAEEMRAYLDQGHFAAGSMGPKVEAALRFVSGHPRRRAIITRLDLAQSSLNGGRGTHIMDVNGIKGTG